MSTLLISATAFVGVAALVGAVAMLFRGEDASRMEDRLSAMASGKAPTKSARASLLSEMSLAPTAFDLLLKKLGSFSKIFEQADTNITAGRFFAICGGLLGAGVVITLAFRWPWWTAPLLGSCLSLLPFAWLLLKRRSRLRKFAAQLPQALELVARALRAGHSLASGMGLVASEAQPPIRDEFQRVFEAQNLGQSLEDSLKAMTERVPNLDLKFFVTAVILQRQTGGDLAEILDKIGSLIRERFKIWGQVQALTGEGRLSGVVLLGLPVVLFFAVYWLNPEYEMMLFTEPLGHKMLATAVVMQLLGALVIRKIVNIKV